MKELNYKKITWAEASEKYELRFKLNQNPNNYEDLTGVKCVALFEGDIHLEKLEYNEDYASFFTPDDENVLAIIVDGNLTVDTIIDLYDTVGLPGMVYVTGNLKAENILLQGMGELVVNGNIDLGYSFFAQESMGGQLVCKGQFSTQYGYIYDYQGMVDIRNLVNGKIYCLDQIEDDCGFIQTDGDWIEDKNGNKVNILTEKVEPYLQTPDGRVNDLRKFKHWILEKETIFNNIEIE